MGSVTLRLCEIDEDGGGGETADLPAFYMNDWSELALRVSALRPAMTLLGTLGVKTFATRSGTRLEVETLAELPAIVAKLLEIGLTADLSDRVSGIYQG